MLARASSFIFIPSIKNKHMKILFSIIVLFSMAKGCSQEEVKSFEYEALSRGFFYKVTIDKEQIAVQNSRDSKPTTYTLSPENWKELNKLAAAVDMASISTLEPPSTQSHYDGAAMANLKVETKESTYTSNGFDHQNPPAALQPLVSKILQLAEEK